MLEGPQLYEPLSESVRRAADAVGWAKEILRLYGDLDTSNNAQRRV